MDCHGTPMLVDAIMPAMTKTVLAVIPPVSSSASFGAGLASSLSRHEPALDDRKTNSASTPDHNNDSKNESNSAQAMAGAKVSTLSAVVTRKTADASAAGPGAEVHAKFAAKANEAGLSIAGASVSESTPSAAALVSQAQLLLAAALAQPLSPEVARPGAAERGLPSALALPLPSSNSSPNEDDSGPQSASVGVSLSQPQATLLEGRGAKPYSLESSVVPSVAVGFPSAPNFGEGNGPGGRSAIVAATTLVANSALASAVGAKLPTSYSAKDSADENGSANAQLSLNVLAPRVHDDSFPASAVTRTSSLPQQTWSEPPFSATPSTTAYGPAPGVEPGALNFAAHDHALISQLATPLSGEGRVTAPPSSGGASAASAANTLPNVPSVAKLAIAPIVAPIVAPPLAAVSSPTPTPTRSSPVDNSFVPAKGLASGGETADTDPAFVLAQVIGSSEIALTGGIGVSSNSAAGEGGSKVTSFASVVSSSEVSASDVSGYQAGATIMAPDIGDSLNHGMPGVTEQPASAADSPVAGISTTAANKKSPVVQGSSQAGTQTNEPSSFSSAASQVSAQNVPTALLAGQASSITLTPAPATAPSVSAQSTTVVLPQPHQMLDSTPAVPSTPPAAPIVPGSAADLKMNAEVNAQIHVGVRTDSFGAVEIHTVVQQNLVGITVHAERDIARWFSSEVPGLESGLNKSHLNLTAVEFDNGRSGMGAADSFRQGQSRQNSSQTPAGQGAASPEKEMSGNSSAAGTLRESFAGAVVTRVSIHA